VTYLQGECSYRRAEYTEQQQEEEEEETEKEEDAEEEEDEKEAIQCRSSGRSQSPPCLAEPAHAHVHGAQHAVVLQRVADQPPALRVAPHAEIDSVI
jgi:hypothetical protein